MTQDNNLNTPWTLHFDRDGTEDYGIICDAKGNDLVASHLPGSKVARIADRPFGTGCFWLPEENGDPIPQLVQQMQVMTAAPKLLYYLKLAVAADTPEHRTWVQEARDTIAEATGQEFDRQQAKEAQHLHMAAPQLYDALLAAVNLLDEYKTIADAAALLFSCKGAGRSAGIEEVRDQAVLACVHAG